MSMTSRERVMKAVMGEEVDYAPVANPTPCITAELQDKVGVYFPEANYDGEKMAKLAIGGRTICGFDSVNLIFGGGANEAAAMGCEVDWGDQGNLPSVLTHIWDHPDQIEMPEDYLERPPIKACLDGIRIAREELGDEVAIIGKAYGPWSLNYHFFGIENFMLDLFRDKPKAHAQLEGLKAFTKAFIRAQIEAGADTVNYNDLITGDLVRPETYPEFLLDIHQEISAEMPAPLIFHCCGKSMDRIKYFNESGFACYSFESANDAAEMRAQATKIRLCGNVNTTQTILFGTPEDVEKEVFYALDSGIDIISNECATPPNGKLECVIAMREARDKYYDTGRHERRGEG